MVKQRMQREPGIKDIEKLIKPATKIILDELTNVIYSAADAIAEHVPERHHDKMYDFVRDEIVAEMHLQLLKLTKNLKQKTGKPETKNA